MHGRNAAASTASTLIRHWGYGYYNTRIGNAPVLQVEPIGGLYLVNVYNDGLTVQQDVRANKQAHWIQAPFTYLQSIDVKNVQIKIKNVKNVKNVTKI